MTDKTALQALIKELGLHMDINFVPRSHTDNAKETDVGKMQIHWKYRVYREKIHTELTGPYSQGIGHLPKNLQVNHSRVTVYEHNAVVHALENGYAPKTVTGSGFALGRVPLVKPTIEDVLYCLMSDGSAIDSPTYEDWASDLGYDADSRKGEQVYRTCVEIGLKLRAMLGEASLSKLSEAYQDY